MSLSFSTDSSPVASLSGFPGQDDFILLSPTRDDIAIHEHLNEIDRLHQAQVAALHAVMDMPCAEGTTEEEWNRLIQNRYLEHLGPVDPNFLSGLMQVSDSDTDSEWDGGDNYYALYDDTDSEDGFYAPVSPHVHFAPGLQLRFDGDDPMDVISDDFERLSLTDGSIPERLPSPITPCPPPPSPAPIPLSPPVPAPGATPSPQPITAPPRRRADTPHPQVYIPPGRRPHAETHVFYTTPIAGAFDTQPPSDIRKAEYIAERVAANCHTIAMSPDELTRRLLQFDDESKLEIFRLSEALCANVSGEQDASPIVRINRCAVQPYGFDFECENAAGDTLWQRDIDLLHSPGAQKLVYEFWENAPRTLTLEQIFALRQLPQYAFGEGERILAPMWQRALSQDQSVTSRNIV